MRPAPPPVRRGVRRSALADALEAEDDEQQEEAARGGDGRPMLAPHGFQNSFLLRTAPSSPRLSSVAHDGAHRRDSSGERLGPQQH